MLIYYWLTFSKKTQCQALAVGTKSEGVSQRVGERKNMSWRAGER